MPKFSSIMTPTRLFKKNLISTAVCSQVISLFLNTYRASLIDIILYMKSDDLIPEKSACIHQ